MDANTPDSALNEYQHILTGCVRRNLPLILALQLEVEDVVQDLTLRLFKAVERYDNNRTCPFQKFLYHELQHEILDIRKRHKPHGIVGVPRDLRLDVVYLDHPGEDGRFYEVPVDVDFDGRVDEAIGILPQEERAVVIRKMNGEPIRKKAERERLAHAREMLSGYFFERKYEYA